ncbi:DUF3592 domain-containing protein [Enterobacteriaceae bacterium 4M9]|nr:DUF3592 domain-containing protein [Enterobacteriaceae bacterium 4M9]
MKRTFTFFLFFGCMMLGLSFYQAWSEAQFEKNALRTTGKVVDLGLDRSEGQRIWYPVVSFYDSQGKKNEFTSSVGSAGYHSMRGQDIEVLYLADEPDEARISGFEGQYVGSLVMGIFGVGFALMGALPPLLMRSRQNRTERLMHEGQPIEATILGAVINSAVDVNGQSPWRIVCQFVDEPANKTYLFHSDNIYVDPSPWIKTRKQTVVYLDKNNIKKYHVDISWLPEQRPELIESWDGA